MKLLDLVETEKEKQRPKKTLWFDNYTTWVHDIKLRFPEAEAHKDNSSGDVIAVNMSGEKSYGVWRSKRNLGVAYAEPRPLHTVVHPRTKMEKQK